MYKRSLVLISLALAGIFGSAAATAGDDNKRHRKHDRHHVERNAHSHHGHAWNRHHQDWRHGHQAQHRPGHGSGRPVQWDRDGDGVPNRHDRRPNNPYRY